MKDYYKILEVEENASEDDIKKSYRTLSKKYHPDLNPDGAEKFKEINEAYEVVGDKQRRVEYDAKKNNPYAGTSFESLFSQMFSGRPQQPRRKQAPDKYEDVYLWMENHGYKIPYNNKEKIENLEKEYNSLVQKSENIQAEIEKLKKEEEEHES